MQQHCNSSQLQRELLLG